MKVRTEARREAILEVASQVFVEFGFKRASMIEIVRRLGGSKSTIYGYYPSKEVLFQEVTRAAGEKQIRTAFDELASPNAIENIDTVLAKFAEKMVEFMCLPDPMATHRMVLAEAGHSNVGELFYEAGPKKGIAELADFFTCAMLQGRMQRADPLVAAQQFFALLQAETQPLWYYREPPRLSMSERSGVANRAFQTFSKAYIE